jgi:bifunctional DNA-binding transcriptional regulator/antitoxin component of YhaV-PrlF toxin-antitoxin module
VSLAKVSEKGQLTPPAEIRRKYEITKASYVRIIPLEDEVKLVPVNSMGIASLRGVVQVDGPQDFDAIRRDVMEARHRERH